MSRSIWKSNFIEPSVLLQDKVWTRRSVIPSFLVGKSVSVHYGNGFKKITITREKVGFKFGSFSYTRRSGNKKRMIKSKKK